MSFFQFKHFKIIQEVAAVKVGTDAMLLGAFVEVSNVQRILEIGTGTGVISLMLAQKNPFVSIDALEIHPDTAKEASLNVSNSKYAHTIKVLTQDILTFTSLDKYDLIVTNPPYFEHGLLPENPKDNLAKHIDKARLHKWFEKIADLLSESGKCWMILPLDSLDEWIELANSYQLFLSLKLILFAKPSVSKRVIVCFTNIYSDVRLQDFCIRNSDGSYTSEYIALTKEFHDRVPVR